MTLEDKIACVAGKICKQAIFDSGMKFNLTLHQSPHGFAAHIHSFDAKTKALKCKILPATQAKDKRNPQGNDLNIEERQGIRKT